MGVYAIRLVVLCLARAIACIAVNVSFSEAARSTLVPLGKRQTISALPVPIPVLRVGNLSANGSTKSFFSPGNLTTTNSITNITSKDAKASFSSSQLNIRAPTQKNGPYSYFKAVSKFSVSPTLREAQKITLNLASKVAGSGGATQQSASGFAASTAASDDSQWLTEIQIGTPPQTLLLNFDTGSSDLWLFSTDLPISERQNQVLYNPANSATALAAPSSTWNITYADSSGASGFVGTDTVYLGGLPIKNQAIERATFVSKNFFSNQLASGLLGLAFSAINTVKPSPVITPVENMIRQGLIKNPVFTVTMKDSGSSATGQGGHYTFGYIDTSSHKGQITYAAVNTSQGFWQVNSPYFKIGRNGTPLPRSAGATKGNLATRAIGGVAQDELANLGTDSQGLSIFNASTIASKVAHMGEITKTLATAAGGLQNTVMPNHQVIIDTGTTLMLIDDMTLLTIYNAIPGAVYNSSLSGYTLPCTTTSPDTFYMLGDKFYGIPGSSLPFAKLDNGMCYGGIQSRGTFPMDIYGDTFIKNNYIVFEQGSTPRIGFAYRRDITFSNT